MKQIFKVFGLITFVVLVQVLTTYGYLTETESGWVLALSGFAAGVIGLYRYLFNAQSNG